MVLKLTSVPCAVSVQFSAARTAIPDAGISEGGCAVAPAAEERELITILHGGSVPRQCLWPSFR